MFLTSAFYKKCSTKNHFSALLFVYFMGTEKSYKYGEKRMQTENITNYIDVNDGVARIMGNKAVYKTLLGSFAKNTYLDQLTQEIEAQDFEAASRTAHALKGVSANLSLVKINGQIIKMEAMLKAGQDVRSEIPALKEAIETTLLFIEQLSTTL